MTLSTTALADSIAEEGITFAKAPFYGVAVLSFASSTHIIDISLSLI